MNVLPCISSDSAKKWSFLFAILMVLITGPVMGQHELQSAYDSLFQTGRSLINGKMHHGNYPRGNGHPFFGEFNWRGGVVRMDPASIPYHAIRYDLLNDHLLIQHFSESGSHVIIVNNDLAGEFELDGHLFCFIERQGGRKCDLEPGYYEAAYRSESEIWIKWKKTFAERTQGQGQYELAYTLYIKNKENCFRITNRKSLLMALQDRGDVIRAYLKQHKISVSQAGIDQMIDVVKYYDGQSKLSK